MTDHKPPPRPTAAGCSLTESIARCQCMSLKELESCIAPNGSYLVARELLRRYRALEAAARPVLELAQSAHRLCRDELRDEDPTGWDEEEIGIMQTHKALADLLGVALLPKEES